jgi:peptide/nickel transport system substrate-binding protein
MTMRSKLRWLLPVLAIVVFATGLAACGDDDDDGGDGGEAAAVPEEYAPPTAAPDDAQEGGELKVLANGDVDFMDPGPAYYQFTYMLTMAGHRNLLGWAPDDVEEPTPDGAEEYPEVSEDGLKITFTIRDGMRFSPPVDREITAADYEYAIERSLLPGVAPGYVPLYLGDIVGFEQAQKQAEDDPTGGAPDIEGVTAVDDRTLEIELDEPTSAIVIQSLTLPVSAPVPEEYAKEFDAANPSEYGNHVVFSGPYMVENDESGELTGYTPGREIRMVRNPNWDPETDFRPAYLDSIVFQEGFSDTVSASRKILDGSASVNGDFNPPAVSLKEAAGKEAQLTLTPSGGNRYVAMNTQEPPFDDVNVRKAAIANSDREALRNTRGGELVGPVATHFLPPEMPGFEEAGGLEGTGLDYLANPNGDPELAAEYMRKAGYDSGKCEGPECEITIFGEDGPPDKDTAEIVKGQFEDLGFEVNFRLVNPDILYTRFCNAPDQMPNVCPNVGFIKDFFDPQTMLDPTFNGEAIAPANNYNWPLLDVPEINRAMSEAQLLQEPAERAEAWGEIDTMVTEQAPAIPYIWDNQANIQSGDVAGVINLFNAQWDLSFTSLKG